jgi:hypothetical protein
MPMNLKRTGGAMTTITAVLAARRRVTIAALTGIVLIAGLVLVTGSGGSDSPVPITPALLARAAHAAEAQGSGYDYACQIYNAPRQLLCQGQGDGVMFIVTPTGQLQLEPGSEQ